MTRRLVTEQSLRRRPRVRMRSIVRLAARRGMVDDSPVARLLRSMRAHARGPK